MATERVDKGSAGLIAALSGIRWALAREFVRRGYSVLAVASRREWLEALTEQSRSKWTDRGGNRRRSYGC